MLCFWMPPRSRDCFHKDKQAEGNTIPCRSSTIHARGVFAVSTNSVLFVDERPTVTAARTSPPAISSSPSWGLKGVVSLLCYFNQRGGLDEITVLVCRGEERAGDMFTQGRSTMAAQQVLVGGLPCSRPSAAGQRGRGAAYVTCVATPTRPPTTKTAKRCAACRAARQKGSLGLCPRGLLLGSAVVTSLFSSVKRKGQLERMPGACGSLPARLTSVKAAPI